MSEPGQDRLQPGIYFRPKKRPAACWRLVLLDLESGIGANEARAAVAALDAMLSGLRAGSVRDLLGQPTGDLEATRATFEELDWLWGYGRRFFDPDLHDPPLTSADRPEFLAYLPVSGEPFPTLPWDRGADRAGEADLALQLTADSEAAVNRAAVEVWKLLEDERLPLRVAASFDGFVRPDGRGWLEFHDGVSNVESSQRVKVLTAVGDPGWMAGGTYMAFLRCRVALTAWRSLPRPEQELIVGRDKLTGSPLVATKRDESGRALPVPAAALPTDPSDEQLADYHDPPPLCVCAKPRSRNCERKWCRFAVLLSRRLKSFDSTISMYPGLIVIRQAAISCGRSSSRRSSPKAASACVSSQRSFASVTGETSCWARYSSTSSASVRVLARPRSRRTCSSARSSAAPASSSLAKPPRCTRCELRPPVR
jgi:deferrochelatase/peroxidase EfeB